MYYSIQRVNGNTNLTGNSHVHTPALARASSIKGRLAAEFRYYVTCPCAYKMASLERSLKPGFYRVELFKTVWEVPECYQDLSPIGTGAYGTVW